MENESDLWGSVKDGDFEEANVWDLVKEKKGTKSSEIEAEAPENQNLSSSETKMIPIIRTSSGISEHDSSVEEVKKKKKQQQQQSAPVKIPDWSKMSKHPDDSDDDDCMIPPHEIISQRLARSQVSTFSVLEGVGRTLKGRDLRKVRNAVLTKSGFLE